MKSKNQISFIKSLTINYLLFSLVQYFCFFFILSLNLINIELKFYIIVIYKILEKNLFLKISKLSLKIIYLINNSWNGSIYLLKI